MFPVAVVGSFQNLPRSEGACSAIDDGAPGEGRVSLVCEACPPVDVQAIISAHRAKLGAKSAEPSGWRCRRGFGRQIAKKAGRCA